MPPYPPWLRSGPEPSPEQRARRASRARAFAAALSAFVQLPGVAFAIARLWHGAGSGSGTDAVLLGATLCGFVAAALLLLPWRGPAVIAVAAFAVPAIAFAPGPPLAAVAVAFAAGRAVLGGASVWAWSTLAGMGTIGAVSIAVSGVGAPSIRLLIVTVVLCVITGAVSGAGARRERFRAVAREEASRRRSAAEEERLRIARELHDVLAHSLSQISVQAGVALHLFDDDPERARESLRSIRDTSTTALDEVRGVLGVLRETGDAAPSLRPGPSLAAIPVLLDEARRSGLVVTATGNATDPRWQGAGTVSSATQSAAYRIVQEGLTNVRRHAGASTVEVGVEASADAVTVRIANPPASQIPTASLTSAAPNHPAGDGSAAASGPGSPSDGRGILGMRERAAALGGTLDAGPTQAGGFVVYAWLPARTRETTQ